ncbi:hypothetical protein CSPAE12_00746 [Colletotrichum incanum]|nr:hypothetical protein CSPAE12_00746 [Colletotrichum incanum]
MRGLAQALLLAPALVGAAPSKIGMEKAQHASPSTFVTFNIPPGFNEDQPKPYTLHLEVLEAPSPCAYPNVKVNDNPLSLGGHTLGRGTFAGDHDGTTFIASWSATCAGDEQLLRFTLESLAGRTLASDLAFVARFRQTAPAAIIEVAGNVQVSEQHPLPPSKPLPEFDRHSPRPGDDEDGLLEDPPFPPPPHHHVGNHPDNHPGEHHDEEHRHRPGRPASPQEDEHVLAELRELDCLRHQLHALKHAIHEKESRLAQEHGVFLHHGSHRAFKECDSLKCIIETFMHRVGGGFRGQGRGRHGGPGRDHHGPPDSCPGFPFPEHGNHGNGNHTLPPPPPPEGSPDGPPKGPPGPPKGPHHGHHEGPPPPPPSHEPHRGPPGHHGPPPPPPPPPSDEPFHGPPHHPEGPHHGGPPGFPPPGPPPDFEHEHPLDAEGSQHRRPHPHGPPGHQSPPPPPPSGFRGPRLPLPVKITVAILLLVGVLALLHAGISRSSSRRESRRECKHSRRARHRRDYREARKEAFKASLADLWSRMFADRVPSDVEDEEKRAFLSGAAHPRPSTSSDEGDFETMESMTSEITEFRNAATLVTEMVAAEERRQRMREQEQQQQQQQQHLQMPMPHSHRGASALVTPPSPTAAFAEYMGDEVLPAYDEYAPSVVVSDGFSSYSPGSTEYVPGASSDTASNIDSVLGDPKN